MFLLSRLKLYGIAIGAFILGIIGVYYSGRRDGAARVKADLTQDRLDAIETAKEVDNEINALDDDAVISAGSEWVRKD